jgi:hypothetical protein
LQALVDLPGEPSHIRVPVVEEGAQQRPPPFQDDRQGVAGAPGFGAGRDGPRPGRRGPGQPRSGPARRPPEP